MILSEYMSVTCEIFVRNDIIYQPHSDTLYEVREIDINSQILLT